MAFPQDDLQEDEEVVIETRPHWLQMVRTFVALAVSKVVLGVATVLTLVFASRYEDASAAWLVGGLCLALVPLSFTLAAWRSVLYWWYTRYVVTNRRLILRFGVLRRHKRDFPLRRVQDTRLDQGIIARIVGAGDLVIETAGKDGAIPLEWVPKAEEVRHTVHKLAREIRREEPVEQDEGL